MICRQGTFVEYSVFGKETTSDWTIISDAKGKIIIARNIGESNIWQTGLLQYLKIIVLKGKKIPN